METGLELTKAISRKKKIDIEIFNINVRNFKLIQKTDKMKKHFISVKWRKKNWRKCPYLKPSKHCRLQSTCRRKRQNRNSFFARQMGGKQSGKINRRLVFDTEEKADAEFWILKPSHIEKPLEVVPVREFLIWYRQWDDKDFLEFYTDTPNLEDAVQEAVEHLRGHVLVIMTYTVVARHAENFIKEPEKRR